MDAKEPRMAVLRGSWEDINTKAGRDFALALGGLAYILEEFSKDEENPNISAWLREEAIDFIALIEHEAAVVDDV